MHRLLGTGITHERQIGNDHRPLAAAPYQAGVVDHLLQSHRHGALLPLQHHAKRIPDQRHRYSRLIQKMGKTGIVGGEGSELLSSLFHLAQGSDVYSGHGELTAWMGSD